MNFFQLISLSLCGVVITVILKQLNPAFAQYCSAACAIIITCAAFMYLRPLVEYANEIAAHSLNGDLARIVMRITAIGAITSLASDIGETLGEPNIAGRITLLGKGAIALNVLPVLKSIIMAAEKLLLQM